MKQLKSYRSGPRFVLVLLLLAVVLWQPGLIGAEVHGPAVLDAQARQLAERAALNSTVRINCEKWQVCAGESGYEIDNRVGHATVVDGRYLVTHNHFSYLFGDTSDDDAYSLLRVCALSGNSIYIAPLASIKVVAQDEQTLVLDLGDEGAAALNSVSSLSSAKVALFPPDEILPGTQVAQVDWDGSETRVDWTTVVAVVHLEDSTKLILADRVEPGASGGGVFVNGLLVASNWTSVHIFSDEGKEIGEVSSAALFSAELLRDLKGNDVAAWTEASVAGDH